MSLQLVILGNGFDLAHGLKTSYWDFINYILKENYKDRDKFNNLVRIPSNFNYVDQVFSPNTSLDFVNNKLLRAILQVNNQLGQNWCDFEEFHFEYITQQKGDLKLINKAFEEIKIELSNYLKIATSTKEEIEGMQAIAGNVISPSLVLNFNYTNTHKMYWGDRGADVINIHGELESIDNPIIFGYSATDAQLEKYGKTNDNELLWYTKKYWYNRTANFQKLDEFLNLGYAIDVIILGHSCGVSDRAILKHIFEHHSVKKIQLSYYNGFDDYNNKQINIDRITSKRMGFSKILNYENSYPVPQKDGNFDEDKFWRVRDKIYEDED